MSLERWLDKSEVSTMCEMCKGVGEIYKSWGKAPYMKRLPKVCPNCGGLGVK